MLSEYLHLDCQVVTDPNIPFKDIEKFVCVNCFEEIGLCIFFWWL